MKEALWIWGGHAVEACLQERPELVAELLLSGDEKSRMLVQQIEALAVSAGVKCHKTPRMPRHLDEHRHQGVCARLDQGPELSLGEFKDFLELDSSDAQDRAAPRVWAYLDGIQDPRNFGAILRSAAAFGVQAVFFPTRNQAPLTGTVFQASAGGAFRLKLVACKFNELASLVEAEAGVMWALDAAGDDLDGVERGARPSLVTWILGSEGEGVRAQVLKQCEKTFRIPMSQSVESLNASVAASIAFYLTSPLKKRAG